MIPNTIIRVNAKVNSMQINSNIKIPRNTLFFFSGQNKTSEQDKEDGSLKHWWNKECCWSDKSTSGPWRRQVSLCKLCFQWHFLFQYCLSLQNKTWHTWKQQSSWRAEKHFAACKEIKTYRNFSNFEAALEHYRNHIVLHVSFSCSHSTHIACAAINSGATVLFHLKRSEEVKDLVTFLRIRRLKEGQLLVPHYKVTWQQVVPSISFMLQHNFLVSKNTACGRHSQVISKQHWVTSYVRKAEA